MRIGSLEEHNALYAKASDIQSRREADDFLLLEDKDLMTLFDIARFLWSNLVLKGEMFICILASSPFGEEEETYLTQIVTSQLPIMSPEPCTVAFQQSEKVGCVTLMAVFIALKHDFAIQSAEFGTYAVYTHDGGMSLFDLDEATRANFRAMGLLS